MRWFASLVLVLPLGVMGCSESSGAGGSAGDGGRGGTMGQEFSCTEQGIRQAIAQGGGPHFFACSGPTAIAALFTVDNDVILDGEGQLETDAIEVLVGVTAELRGFRIRDQDLWADHAGVVNGGELRMTDCSVATFSGGGVHTTGTLTLVNSQVFGNAFGGIENRGELTITDSSVSRNTTGADHEDWGAGIHNTGTLILTNSTVSANEEWGLHGSGGIYNAGGFVTLTNSTVSGNDGDSAGGIFNAGTLTVANVTVSGNTGGGAGIHNEGTATAINSLFDGDCEGEIVSGGHNIESEGDTCGFDQPTDQVNVSEDDLKLGELADNGGLTETHALGAGSVAIDVIPEAECVAADDQPLTTDQRGEPRDNGMCDVGAFEVQP